MSALTYRALAGKNRREPWPGITSANLEAWEKYANVKIGSGDARSRHSEQRGISYEPRPLRKRSWCSQTPVRYPESIHESE